MLKDECLTLHGTKWILNKNLLTTSTYYQSWHTLTVMQQKKKSRNLPANYWWSVLLLSQEVLHCHCKYHCCAS
jgi:hypothetical protein